MKKGLLVRLIWAATSFAFEDGEVDCWAEEVKHELIGPNLTSRANPTRRVVAGSCELRAQT